MRISVPIRLKYATRNFPNNIAVRDQGDSAVILTLASPDGMGSWHTLHKSCEKNEVVALREMLNEILEDWSCS